MVLLLLYRVYTVTFFFFLSFLQVCGHVGAQRERKRSAACLVRLAKPYYT